MNQASGPSPEESDAVAEVGRGGAKTAKQPQRPLPRVLVVLLVLWLALVCGALLLFGMTTLLGAIAAIGIGDSIGSIVLRFIAGGLFVGFGAVAFAALMWVVAGRRSATYSQPEQQRELEHLGLRLASGRVASLAGVHYTGADAAGRRVDLYVRDLRRRQFGSRRIVFAGVRVELFVESALGTRAVVARPAGVMAAALARLNRRFGLQLVEDLAVDPQRQVWARDPAWMRRLVGRPVVAAALEELVPAEPTSHLLEGALHVQPRALYWTARLGSRTAVLSWVQRGLELVSSVVSITDELPQPSLGAKERAMERRSRTDRAALAWWTLGGCTLVLALLCAIPFAVFFVVAVVARAA